MVAERIADQERALDSVPSAGPRPAPVLLDQAKRRSGRVAYRLAVLELPLAAREDAWPGRYSVGRQRTAAEPGRCQGLAAHALGQILRLPPGLRDPPRVIKGPRRSRRSCRAGRQFHLAPENYQWVEPEELDFPSTRAVVVEYEGGRLTRRPAPRTSTGTAQRPPIGKGVLFDWLIRMPGPPVLQELPAGRTNS